MTVPDRAPTVPGTVAQSPNLTVPRAPFYRGTVGTVERKPREHTHFTDDPGHGQPRAWRGDPAEIVAASEPDPLVFLRRLADLVPAWHRDAACAGEPVDVFFPGLGERNTLAMELCGRCPVRVQCRDWAIDEQINHGVFGGMSPAARRAHARRTTP